VAGLRHALRQFAGGVGRAFDLLDVRTREAEYLEGYEFTLADIMIGFSMMVVDGVWARPGKQALESMIAELGQAMLRSLR
jgi:glutathione S-transferase